MKVTKQLEDLLEAQITEILGISKEYAEKIMKGERELKVTELDSLSQVIGREMCAMFFFAR